MGILARFGFLHKYVARAGAETRRANAVCLRGGQSCPPRLLHRDGRRLNRGADADRITVAGRTREWRNWQTRKEETPTALATKRFL